MTISSDPASTGIHAFLSLVRKFADFAGRRGVLALLLMMCGAAFESIGLLLLVPLLSLVIGGSTSLSPFRAMMGRFFALLGAHSSLGQLCWLMAGLAVLMLVRGIMITLRDRAVQSLQIEFIDSLRGDLASALAGAGWDQVLRLRHARVLNAMSSDVQRIAMASNYVLQSCVAIVILLAQAALSFALSPTLALFSFALLAVGAAAMVPVLRRAREMGRFIGGANLVLMDSIGQFLDGLKMAVSQDLQDGFVQEFRSTVRDLTSRQVRYSYRQMAGRTALTTIAALVGAVVFVVGYGALDLAPSILLTFLVVIGRMSGPAAQIQQGFQNLALGLPAYESIAELMSDLRRDAQPRMPDVRHQLSGPIVFEAVSFQHPQADGVLSHGVADIDLVIQPGSVLGIAGTSGAGKTTLVDLLVGLLRPQSGRILVGDVALDERTLPDWRSALSYVSQDPFLFHDTVRRNLAWARPDATEHDMWDALARAGADQIVRGMEGALDAVVGERGTLVSGGERQRIALARALLRKPKLLVLDEATNAIDIESERVLLEQLLAMRPRPTIVIIAHRAETLALCERVVRMKAGQLHAEACSDASDPALLR